MRSSPLILTSPAPGLLNRFPFSAGPIRMTAWSFGGLVVWLLPSWKGCGRAEDGRRFFNPVALPRRSATALEQLGCQVDWWMGGLSGGPDSCPKRPPNPLTSCNFGVTKSAIWGVSKVPVAVPIPAQDDPQTHPKPIHERLRLRRILLRPRQQGAED